MIPQPYNEYLSSYALVENLKFALGITSSEAADIILKSHWIAPLIDNVLFGKDAALPEVDEDENSAIRCLLEMDLVQLRHLSRIIAVLTQSQSLKKSADGVFLRAVREFAGTPGMLNYISDYTPPKINILPMLESVDLNILQQVADMACSLLVGVFPEPYLQRFAFRFPRKDLPAPVGLMEASSEAIGFSALTSRALQVLQEVRDAEISAS